MKKYAVVIDISPSEQLGKNEKDIKVMSILFGLKSHTSFDKVGRDTPSEEQRIELKKWTKANTKYKETLVKHLHYLKSETDVMFGLNVVNDKEIRLTGTELLKRVYGRLPIISSISTKGKPRIKMGGYKIDGETVSDYEILWDEMLVLSWYADSLINLYNMLVSTNGTNEIKLDVLIDNLPLDVNYRKANVLNMICQKVTDGKLVIAGVPEKSDFLQRDLLVDNIAGLNREIIEKKQPLLYGEVATVFGLSRVILK